MASNKPKIVIYSDEETIRALDEIATQHNRSRGNMGETIIKEYLFNHNNTNNNNTTKIIKSNNNNININNKTN